MRTTRTPVYNRAQSRISLLLYPQDARSFSLRMATATATLFPTFEGNFLFLALSLPKNGIFFRL